MYFKVGTILARIQLRYCPNAVPSISNDVVLMLQLMLNYAWKHHWFKIKFQYQVYMPIGNTVCKFQNNQKDR